MSYFFLKSNTFPELTNFRNLTLSRNANKENASPTYTNLGRTAVRFWTHLLEIRLHCSYGRVAEKYYKWNVCPLKTDSARFTTRKSNPAFGTFLWCIDRYVRFKMYVGHSWRRTAFCGTDITNALVFPRDLFLYEIVFIFWWHFFDWHSSLRSEISQDQYASSHTSKR